MTKQSVVAAALTAAITTACAARVPAPEPLPLDRVECSRCGMLISSERGSAEVVTGDGETRFYDDIGCLAADWIAHAHAARGARAFVRTPDGRWADANEAAYARPATVRTAMASGIAAFATVGAAQAADAGGRAITFEEIVRQQSSLADGSLPQASGDPR